MFAVAAVEVVVLTAVTPVRVMVLTMVMMVVMVVVVVGVRLELEVCHLPLLICRAQTQHTEHMVRADDKNQYAPRNKQIKNKNKRKQKVELLWYVCRVRF